MTEYVARFRGNIWARAIVRMHELAKLSLNAAGLEPYSPLLPDVPESGVIAASAF
jgi:hypothetical protein